MQDDADTEQKRASLATELRRLAADIEAAPTEDLAARLSVLSWPVEELSRQAGAVLAGDWSRGERLAPLAAKTFAQQQPSQSYVAFLDALGFSSLVTSDWNLAVSRYDMMVDQISEAIAIWTEIANEDGRPLPRVRMFSDSITRQ